MRPDELDKLLREDLADEAVDGDVSGDLSGALARLAPPAGDIAVPEELDEAILALGRVRLRRRRLVPVLAIAAAVLFAVGATLFFKKGAAAPAPPDIVDAYRLALRLDRGETPEARWDLNGDGRVDAADVTALAQRVVAIEERKD